MADPVLDTDVPAAAPAPVAAPVADTPSAEVPAAEDGKPEGGEGDGGDPATPAPKADEGDDKGNNVETRRHNQQNAATRIATKNSAPAPTDAGGEEGESDTEISKVRSELADIRSREETREDEAEMDKIIAANPDMSKYKEQVKKLATDASRKQVPIKSLFYEAAGDDLIKIGANRASEANADAAETQQNGTSTGNSPDGGSIADMSNDDFSKMQEEVRLKQ